MDEVVYRSRVLDSSVISTIDITMMIHPFVQPLHNLVLCLNTKNVMTVQSPEILKKLKENTHIFPYNIFSFSTWPNQSES